MPTSQRAVLTLAPVLALAALLAGCGDDGDNGAEDVETVYVTEPAPTDTPVTTSAAPPTEDGTTTADGVSCTAVPEVGQIIAPTEEVSYSTGSAALQVTRSDGATGCVPISVDADAGSFDPSGSPELAVHFGTTDAGLHLTVTDYTDDGRDDLAANEGDPFVGVQFQGAYGVDSLHTSCTVALTQLSPSSAAGKITCDAPLDPWSGDWEVTAPDVTIDEVSGWFLVES